MVRDMLQICCQYCLEHDLGQHSKVLYWFYCGINVMNMVSKHYIDQSDKIAGLVYYMQNTYAQ